MSYLIRNITNDPIIGNLGDGSELRLLSKHKLIVTDEQYRGYLEGLAENGDIEVREIAAFADRVEPTGSKETVKTTNYLKKRNKKKKED